MRIDLSKAKAFKTELDAVRRAQKALEYLPNVRWLTVEGPNGFVLVAFLTGAETINARTLIDSGFYVIG